MPRKPTPKAKPQGTAQTVSDTSSPSTVVAAPRSSFRPAPFNPEGENIGNLGPNYARVSIAKWADTTIFAEALEHAHHILSTKTDDANVKLDLDTVLVQEYYSQDRLAFLFAHWSRPKKFGIQKAEWCYVPVVIKLTPPLLAHLVLTNRWPSRTKH